MRTAGRPTPLLANLQVSSHPSLRHLDRRGHGPAGPPKVMKNGSCSATAVPRSTALPFVISTEEVMGLRARLKVMKNGSCSATAVPRSTALPFVISTEEVMGLRARLKVMKNGSCSATAVPRSTALPSVISTEAQRSGEICGFSSWYETSRGKSEEAEGPAVRNPRSQAS
jgi:hypothetical protein